MSQVTTIQPARQSLIASMASQYQMEPKAFGDTIRSTCMPANATNEEFAAFLMVARQYGLNPITREIYAFPKKGGGIQPIVGIDGWFNLINSHPQCDGIEFDDKFAKDGGELTAITCRIFRKDRSRAVSVTEYMAECKRPTEPWQKWPARMLRHKAAIQCARYAFGFAGIIDPEEAERSPEVITGGVVAPPPPTEIAGPRDPGIDPIPDNGFERDIEGDVNDVELDAPEQPFDLEHFLDELDAGMATAKSDDQLMEIWDGFDVEATLTGNDEALQRAFDLRHARMGKFLPANAG